ncbi:hypothetical protein ETQ85_14320 [Zoogloea oleivorans]|uniref:Chemotaxis protein n=1 Tax=Zoogloea oleivorans TaxID=1552750 RepID=A0A6C2CPI3_9RHOO|nr:hypothetical protein [Zoogloea oleivorans]TYC55195.1 hypothetical protein ETQ85_14320 [Zoogloea oleivorans]
MPIPFIIGGAALAAGLFGAKKGMDAKKNYAKAKNLVEDALEDMEASQKRLEKQRERTSKGLKKLGEIRLNAEAGLMRRFVDTIKQVNKVTYKPITLGGVQVHISPPDLQAMEVSSYTAADLLKDGISALSSGVLTGIGAGGLASSIGVASTGTAIGTLSGVAATNATLAWLGGGSLAAGGMGMAGGTAVLGGAIAGPVIAVIGYSAAKKSERALSDAFEKEAEIREGTEQIENGIQVLSSIKERCDEMSEVILGVAQRFKLILEKAESMMQDKHQQFALLEEEVQRRKEEDDRKGVITKVLSRLRGNKSGYSYPDPFDFNNFSEQEKQLYSMLTAFGYALYSLLKVKVLDDDGAVTEESTAAVEEARDIIRSAE